MRAGDAGGADLRAPVGVDGVTGRAGDGCTGGAVRGFAGGFGGLLDSDIETVTEAAHGSQEIDGNLSVSGSVVAQKDDTRR